MQAEATKVAGAPALVHAIVDWCTGRGSDARGAGLDTGCTVLDVLGITV